MAVKVNSLSKIKKKLGIEKGGPALSYMTAVCAKAMDKYVPFDKGTLAGTVIANGKPTGNVTERTITYSQPYAEYVYKGVSASGKPLNYHTDKHSYAGPYWDKRMISAEMDKVCKQVEEAIRRQEWTIKD